jgi:hypothetical protein
VTDPLSEALLSLGREDLIPLWEAAGSPEVQVVVPALADPAAAIGQALRDLVLNGQVQVFEGRWDAEPRSVPNSDAVRLVGDPRWYAYPPDDHRVYYANVENLPAS